MQEDANTRHGWQMICGAVVNEELIVHYQPIIDLLIVILKLSLTVVASQNQHYQPG